MCEDQDDEKNIDKFTPVYLGGMFTLLFAVNAIVCVQRDQTDPSLIIKSAAGTFALASLFLAGLTALNLRQVGEGSLMAGLKNSFFRSPHENNTVNSLSIELEKKASLKCG